MSASALQTTGPSLKRLHLSSPAFIMGTSERAEPGPPVLLVVPTQRGPSWSGGAVYSPSRLGSNAYSSTGSMAVLVGILRSVIVGLAGPLAWSFLW